MTRTMGFGFGAGRFVPLGVELWAPPAFSIFGMGFKPLWVSPHAISRSGLAGNRRSQAR